jgi:hypothetical protein
MNVKFTNCTSCGCEAVLLTNPATGTLFWGCSAHSRTGCKWTASPISGEQWGRAAVVSRRSKKHGQTISLREDIIAKMVGRGMEKSVAIDLINEIGIIKAKELIQN